MSLERTPPRSRDLTSGTDSVNICSICSEVLIEDQSCMIIQGCSHVFHRICIETSLASSAECPVCKRSCQMSELRVFPLVSANIQSTDSPNVLSASKTNSNAQMYKPQYKGRGRGGKVYNTRSNTRNLFSESHNSLNTTQEFRNPDQNNRDQTNNERSGFRNDVPPTPNIPSVDYDYINRMIEQSMSRLLASLTVVPTGAQNVISQTGQNVILTSGPGTTAPQAVAPPSHQPNFDNTNFPNAYSPIQSQGSQNINSNLDVSTTSRINFTIDKISSIIQGWNLKFDGTASGLSVDEFLYRVKSLTVDNLNGDFNLICKNLQILLSGRAREWLWRYRKQVTCVKWEDFCQGIRSQYGDFKTSSDLREEIRNRKQKPGESFDIFFDSISAIIDRLDTPMSETETVETLTRNLRPEIRQDLLYIPIRSVSHLRQLVHKRENFLNDEYVRRTIGSRNNFPVRRQIAEVGCDEISEDFTKDLNAVDALQANSHNSSCWNCDERGHHWQDCVQDRHVFCYGCGAKKIYKPNCPKCQAKTSSLPKNLKPLVPIKEQ